LTGFDLKQFNAGVVWNVASLGFLAGGGILINLIIIRFQGEAALGIFNQVYAIYIILSQLGVGGLQHSALRHISYHQNDRERCADITTAALIVVTVISLAMCLMAALLAGTIGGLLNSPGVAQGLLLALPGLLFFGLNKVLINVLNGLNVMRPYAVFRSLRFVLLPVSLLALIALDQGAPYLALSFTITESLLFIGLAVYVYRRLIPLRWLRQPRARFAEHLSFGLRGVLSGVLSELNTRVDVLMLGYFTNDTLVGVYSFAAIMAEGFAQVPQAVRWNVDPLLGDYFAAGQNERISQLARRVRRVFYPVMGGIGLLAVLAYPVVFGLLAGGEQVETGWLVFAVLMLGVVISAGYMPFSGILLQGDRPALYTLSVGGLVLNNAVFNVLLIPPLGVYGAATATMLTFCLNALLLVILGRRLFGVRL
jgi:O-antigen/teichoic acid export membrane protein